MTQSSDEQRFGEIERRLTRVERHLGLVVAPEPERAVAPAAPPPAPAALAQVAAPPSSAPAGAPLDDLIEMRRAARERLSQPARGLTPPPLPRSSAPPARPAPAAPLPEPAAASVPYSAPTVLTYPTPPKPKPLHQNPLEQVIGIKWAGWIGAVVLVIGAALGIKYAYDQGLFPTVSPSTRLILMSIGAFGLIGAGEWIYRKVGRLSATGFFGAGVACLFVISYAGYGYWPIYSRDTAFVLMALCTLIGAAVAIRGGLVSIAVLALIGGNIAPIVLRGDTTHLVPFFSYLLMLQAVALVLAFWGKSERWWTLRGLSLGTTSVWVFYLLMQRGAVAPWSAGMWFTLTYAALYQLEVILSGLRASRELRHATESSLGAVFSVVTTALVSAAMLKIFTGQLPMTRATWIVTFAAIATLLSVLMNRKVRPLSISFRLQAAALLHVAIPVALSGASISFGWAALALALAGTGMLLNDRTARAAAGVAWMLALGNLAFWAGTHRVQAEQVWLTVFGQPLVAWACIAAAIALSGHAVAFLAGWPSAKSDDENADIITMSRALSFIASGVFAFTAIAALPPLGATAVLLVYAWLLILADRPLSRLLPLAQGCVVLVLVTAKWAAVDVIATRMSPQWNAGTYPPVLNPLMLTAVALAGSLVAIYWLRREALQKMMTRLGGENANPALIGLGIVALIMTFALSFEVDRAVERMAMHVWRPLQLKMFGWTILWSIASLAYFAAYAAIDRTATRRGNWRNLAWTVSAILVAKFLVLDTLIWAVSDGIAGVPAVLNIQMLTAIVVTATLLLTHWLLSRASQSGDEEASLAHRVIFLATLVILWAGSFEIARLVNDGLFPDAGNWSAITLKNFAWTAWWALGLTGFLAYATRLDRTEAERSGGLRAIAVIPALLGIKFLIVDTGLSMLRAGSPNVLVNAQAATGALVLATLIFIRYLLPSGSRARVFASAIAVLIPLWCGTIEINRAFEISLAKSFADPHLAKQVAFSIYFSLYAIACVAMGFRMRASALRYFGLALFALTLVKVGVLDLSKASTGYRFLSFMGLGALLLITSVLYGKLSPRLLRATETAMTE